MPFTSKRQQRAAFGGHIPGFSKERAQAWADETEFDGLPDRAPAEKGKPTLRSKHSGLHAAFAARRDDLVDLFAKLSFAVPKPGQAGMAASHVGSFSGMASSNFLKSPGSTTAAVTNPRISVRNAMTKNMRA